LSLSRLHGGVARTDACVHAPLPEDTPGRIRDDERVNLDGDQPHAPFPAQGDEAGHGPNASEEEHPTHPAAEPFGAEPVTFGTRFGTRRPLTCDVRRFPGPFARDRKDGPHVDDHAR
jgi:hypothetical protein